MVIFIREEGEKMKTYIGNQTEEELVKELDEIVEKIENGTIKTYPAREVLKELTEKYCK